MNGTIEEMQKELQQARDSLQSLAVSKRRGMIARGVGTLCGFVVVGIYVYLFITPILGFGKLLGEPDKLMAMVKAEVEKRDLETIARGELDSLRAMAEIEGKYLLNAKLESIKEAKLQELLFAEAKVLVADLRPVYEQRLTDMLQEAGIVETAKGELDELRRQMQPKIVELLKEKAEMLDLRDLVKEELMGAWEELVPIYRTAITEKLEESGIAEAAADSIQKIVDETLETYRNELQNIQPEIVDALESEGKVLGEELSVLFEEKLEAALSEAIQQQEAYLEEKIEATPEELGEIVENIMAATETALTNVIERRGSGAKARLEDVLGLLDKFPTVKGWSIQELMDEVVHASVMLLKYELERVDLEISIEDK